LEDVDVEALQRTTPAMKINKGGTISLTALAFRAIGRRATFVLMIGIIGAAMFYGSSLVTPALSVLSAVED
jgi:KUP system potassium uptake protein